MTKDYRVDIKVRNGRILARMDELGIPSVSALARICKTTSLTYLCELVAMKVSPRRAKNGEWSKMALDVAAALNAYPEDLWTERQQYNTITRNTASVDMTEDDVERLCSGGIDQTEAKLTVQRMLASADLTARERDIIEARMGGETYREVGREQRLSPEYIRHIESDAFRKIRQAARRDEIRMKDAARASL